MAALGYGMVDTGAYESQAADLGYRYNTDKASNAYGRFLSQQRGERSLGDMSQSFNRNLPNYWAAYNQRGLQGPGVNSGVTKRAMSNYLSDYARDYGRVQSDALAEAQNADLQSANLDAYYNNSLAALEQQKQQEIANAAMAIEMLRPYLGGIV